MKWWYAAVCAFLVPPPAAAADNLAEAARELASKTVAWVGREPVAVNWRNQSSLSQAELAQARAAFEAIVHSAEGAAAEARITLSENQAQYLLVEEARRGDERQIWIASWKRNDGVRPANGSPVTLQKRLLWEQDEPILDVALASDVTMILSPGKLTWVREGRPVTAALGRQRVNWPRDPRGRIRAVGAGFEAFL
ncbi:MAG TPA: hypothetical protein VKE70_32780, partial [Candidatus Solibacter sp.]|nr:hypothetical protein [Candidatus Solibacter sp.]